jgi:hypothetical protein
MRKLRLELERLEVESFETDCVPGQLGTVRARADTDPVAVETEPVGEVGDGFLSIYTCRTCPVVTQCASCVATCETCRGPTCDSCAYTRCPGTDPIRCCVIT